MTPTRGQQLRRIGWLLTPLVVWAASFLGAWLGALLAGKGGGPAGGIGIMVAGAVILSLVAVAVWVLLLRRGTRVDVPPEAVAPDHPPEESS